MKKLLIVAAVAIIATAGFYGKNEKKENGIVHDTIIEDVGTALAEQAVIEIEETFKNQVDDFWKSNDFSQMVGWTEEEKQQLTNALQDYVSEYEWDTKELVKLKEKVTKLLNDSEFLETLKGITKEELDAKLADLLSGQ